MHRRWLGIARRTAESLLIPRGAPNQEIENRRTQNERSSPFRDDTTGRHARAGGAIAAPEDFEGEEPIGGAFVTFWNGKRLRGCVGTFLPSTDIAATIAEVTQSALNDSRFVDDPITVAELPELDIEISLLSDAVLTDDPASLITGVHGLIVQEGEKSGCFLPKVASDRGWTAREFLSNCCTMKAGLPPDAWEKPSARVLIFTSRSFRESDFQNPRCDEGMIERRPPFSPR